MSIHKAIVFRPIGKRPSSIEEMADIANDGGSIFGDGGETCKRRRLNHLSNDEKMMRRKMKNRVAAQTARDRKKALMQELEETVAQLQEENKQLLKENDDLRKSQSTILKENEYLKRINNVFSTSLPCKVEVADVQPTSLSCKVEVADVQSTSLPCKVEVADCTALSCKTEPVSPRSAAPAVSLPKEQIQVLSHMMMYYAVWALTVSLMLCFISWKNSVKKVESTASSRKRKQTNPARRPSVTSESNLLLKKCPTGPTWWGPHQQTWTPSMN